MTHIYIDVPIPSTGPPPITINTGDTPTTLIELTLSAEDLINADVLSKSGTFVHSFIKSHNVASIRWDHDSIETNMIYASAFGLWFSFFFALSNTHSDPFCIIRMKESWQDKFCEIGRTEKIKDNLNPQWVKKFLVNYNFRKYYSLAGWVIANRHSTTI